MLFVIQFLGIFKNIFGNSANPEKINFSSSCSINESLDYYFSNDEVLDLIHKLKPYNGFDSVSSFHLKFAPGSLISILTRCINISLNHSYIPGFICKGIMTPLIKDKLGSSDKLKDYRPIIQSSVFLRLIESLLLPRI